MIHLGENIARKARGAQGVRLSEFWLSAPGPRVRTWVLICGAGGETGGRE